MNDSAAQLHLLDALWQQDWTDSTAYRLKTRWTAEAPIVEVASILSDSQTLSQWWPQFLESEVTSGCGTVAGSIPRVGRTVRVVTKGWLPYKLRFQFRLARINFPNYFQIQASGDFEGTGTGGLKQVGQTTVIDFDWNITVNKPLLKWWSFLLKPLFIHNHRWLMRQGESQLRSALAGSSARAKAA